LRGVPTLHPLAQYRRLELTRKVRRSSEEADSRGIVAILLLVKPRSEVHSFKLLASSNAKTVLCPKIPNVHSSIPPFRGAHRSASMDSASGNGPRLAAGCFGGAESRAGWPQGVPTVPTVVPEIEDPLYARIGASQKSRQLSELSEACGDHGLSLRP